jgi:selenocysteine lyase/cysteine desulfurase
MLRSRLAAIPGIRLPGPDLEIETLPVATFIVEGVPHALAAARLSAEDAIGVRHGCFCAHPYLIRLLGLSRQEVETYRHDIRRADRSRMPGAVRASAGINTTEEDVEHLLSAIARIANGEQAPVEYRQDPHTGDFSPDPAVARWQGDFRVHGAACSPG